MFRYGDLFRYAPDETGGTTNTGDGTGDAGVQQGAGDQKPGTTTTITFTPEQQAHLETILSERLKRAKTSWDEASAKAQKKAQDEADAKKLAEQNEFKTLAEQRQAKVGELEGQLAATNAQLQQMQMEQAFRESAEALKAQFANVQAMKDAFALLDKANVKIEEGKVVGMEVAVKALQAQRPYLFAQTQAQGGNLNPADGRGSGKPADIAAREAELRRRFRL
jgi:hypothetical protein